MLFISNGYGEDTMAAHIAKKIQEQNPDYTVAGFPTVGPGKSYSAVGIELAGRGAELPSEGFVRSVKIFVKDVRNGFFTKTFNLGRRLGKASINFDYLVLIGDPYLLLFTSLLTPHKPERKIFVGVQQSEWYESLKPFKLHYSFIERIWMRWFSRMIYVRDEKTKDYLHKKGMRYVRCCGNPMMDCFEIHSEPILPRDGKIIGVLPGSKQEAYNNLGVIFKIIENLNNRGQIYQYAIALSPHLEVEKVVERFSLRPLYTQNRAGEVLYTLYTRNGLKSKIILSQKIFGDILNESAGIIGASGTGNEQAVGMGKPVFGFWGKGPQITEKFMRAQKRLLGKSLILSPPDPALISEKIKEVMHNAALLQEIRVNGKMRMAGIGSGLRMAGEIHQYISTSGRAFR
jgi:uncharacterized protein (TIGR03492 family)